jgi:hypothetical protein
MDEDGLAKDECTPGSEYEWPGFDETLPEVASGSTQHRGSHAYSFDGMQVPSTRPGSTAVTSVAAVVGRNWQNLDRASWKVCGGQLVIEAGATVQFGGGGLTPAELRECAEDLRLPQCSTMARYCSGALSVGDPREAALRAQAGHFSDGELRRAGPRLALQPGIQVKSERRRAIR